MIDVPESVSRVLGDAIYARRNVEMVAGVLAALDVKHDLLRSFFERYEGPFWSENTGYEVLDILDGDETIQSATEICRKQFLFPVQFLVLSRLSAGQVVVLDTLDDKVYEVDFEGGEALLLAGQLAPRWESFRSFLNEFILSESTSH